MVISQIVVAALLLSGPAGTTNEVAPPKHSQRALVRAHYGRRYVRRPLTRTSKSAPVPWMIPASDSGLVGYWRGDGCPCDLTKQNPGIATGGVTYAPAMAGNGFRFNGRDDSIRIPDTTTLALTGSLTISGWINVESYPTEADHLGLILFRGDDRAGLDPYKLGVGSDHRLMFHIGSTKSETEITAPIANRRFVLVTATLDAATGEMRLYENAVLVARTVTVARPLGALDPTQNPSIGIGNCNAIPDSRFRYPFHGIINDLRLYSRPLAQAEIRSLYAGSLQVPDEIKFGK